MHTNIFYIVSLHYHSIDGDTQKCSYCELKLFTDRTVMVEIDWVIRKEIISFTHNIHWWKFLKESSTVIASLDVNGLYAIRRASSCVAQLEDNAAAKRHLPIWLGITNDLLCKKNRSLSFCLRLRITTIRLPDGILVLIVRHFFTCYCKIMRCRRGDEELKTIDYHRSVRIHTNCCHIPLYITWWFAKTSQVSLSSSSSSTASWRDASKVFSSMLRYALFCYTLPAYCTWPILARTCLAVCG